MHINEQQSCNNTLRHSFLKNFLRFSGGIFIFANLNNKIDRKVNVADNAK